MKKKPLFISLAVVAAAILWYLFRPELLFVSRAVDEALPSTPVSTAASPKLIADGSFHSAAHETRGTASIYRLPDGQRVLRLTGFETSNGPDVQVYLGKAADASDNETVSNAGFYNLGALKGTVGDQNYDIPADLDLSEYQSVTIWCRRFSVNFGTAPLGMRGAAEPVVLSSGQFHSAAHETKGTASIYRLPDGKRVLRLTGFETSNGPDVQVYLGKAADASDNETVSNAGFYNLGALKGTVGDQNYDIPADLDLSQYQSVTIWCRRFSVNFGTAPLKS